MYISPWWECHVTCNNRNSVSSTSSDIVSKSSTTSNIGMALSSLRSRSGSRSLGNSLGPYIAVQRAFTKLGRSAKSAGRSLSDPSENSDFLALTQHTAIRVSLELSRISRANL